MYVHTYVCTHTHTHTHARTHTHTHTGAGNSTVVFQSGCPGLSLARFICFRKMKIYQHVINSFPPVLTIGSTKAVHVVHVLSCLCDNACKRSLAVCRKSRASCPVSRLLSVPIWPACAEGSLTNFDLFVCKRRAWQFLT